MSIVRCAQTQFANSVTTTAQSIHNKNPIAPTEDDIGSNGMWENTRNKCSVVVELKRWWKKKIFFSLVQLKSKFRRAFHHPNRQFSMRIIAHFHFHTKPFAQHNFHINFTHKWRTITLNWIFSMIFIDSMEFRCVFLQIKLTLAIICSLKKKEMA